MSMFARILAFLFLIASSGTSAHERNLDSARGRLGKDGSVELEERRSILVALGEAALTEHAEWSLMHRERPLPHSRI